MGLDMSYQAIPAKCNLIERARNERIVGKLLHLVPHWLQNGFDASEYGSWSEGEALWQYLCEMAKQYPGIEQWNFALDRSWDELHYLLSATRRGERATDEDALLDKALRGSREIADHVRTSQGLHVRYVTPSEVKQIGTVLEPMHSESLRAHYAPEKMEQCAIYKFWADRAGTFESLSLHDYFYGFRAFYLDAARRGDGIFVCLD